MEERGSGFQGLGEIGVGERWMKAKTSVPLLCTLKLKLGGPHFFRREAGSWGLVVLQGFRAWSLRFGCSGRRAVLETYGVDVEGFVRCINGNVV